MLVDTEYYMYPLRLEVTSIVKLDCNLFSSMSKKKSGKKPSIRHGGRRRFRPGPKPNSSKSKDQPIEPFCMDMFLKQQNEKIITSHLKGTETEKKIRAFHGWKSLHEGLKQILVTGVCTCEACLLRIALEQAFGDPIENRKYLLGSYTECFSKSDLGSKEVWGVYILLNSLMTN